MRTTLIVVALAALVGLALAGGLTLTGDDTPTSQADRTAIGAGGPEAERHDAGELPAVERATRCFLAGYLPLVYGRPGARIDDLQAASPRLIAALRRDGGRVTPAQAERTPRLQRVTVVRDGAIVTVAVQNVYAPEWTAVANVATSRHGYFRAMLEPGYHRRVAVLYYPMAWSEAPLFSRRLLIRTRSRVALCRPFHRGRAYRFDGQVSAGIAPIPPGGLLVGLQVRNSRGNWVTARLARTRPSGRFRIRYTFDRAPGLAIRVVAPAQPGWALYVGHTAGAGRSARDSAQTPLPEPDLPRQRNLIG